MDVRDRESTVTLGIIPLREVLDHRENFRYFPAAHDAEGESKTISYGGLENALAERNIQIRLFGKPYVAGKRRMGVALARGENASAGTRRDALSVTIKRTVPFYYFLKEPLKR